MLFRSCTAVLPIARPCTLSIIGGGPPYRMTSQIVDWSSHMHGRSLPRSKLHAWFLGRSSPRLCWFIGYARSFFIWNDRSSPSRLVFLERPVAPLVHCRVNQLCRRCTTVHQVEQSFHRPSSESLTECPQLCCFVQKVLVFAIILSGMLF